MPQIDWQLIQNMRQGFLDTQGEISNYWHDEAWLEAYELTLAQRILWKWQAVLAELGAGLPIIRDIDTVIDWGCGTGIASRAFFAAYPDSKAECQLYDRSHVAMQFAAKKLAAASPGRKIALVKHVEVPRKPFVLLVSHVLSELDEKTFVEVQQLAKQASAVLWVEPGRRLESRRLSLVQGELRQSQQILGPCPHQARCGVLQEGRQADWCHFFAPIPSDVYQSAFWREFSQRMKIDLRSLPVAFLITCVAECLPSPINVDSDRSIIIGRTRKAKGYCQFMSCNAEGLAERRFQQKWDKAMFKILVENQFMSVFPTTQIIAPEGV